MVKGFCALLAALSLAIAVGVVLVGADRSGEPAGARLAGCSPGDEVVCVTAADSGQRLHVRVGEELRVVLSGPRLIWRALREIGPQLLHPATAPAASSTALSRSYRAVAVGRTELQATASPQCSRNQACPQFLVLWRVEIIVG